MVGLRSDCLERRLRVCFEMMGHLVGSHPWWFLVTPLLLSTGLGFGFYFLQDSIANDIEEQFTPVNGQAKEERRYIQETFPGNESMFSRLRLSSGGNYATLIATSEGDVLTTKVLQNIVELDSEVRSMVVHHGNQSFQYKDICARVMGYCTPNNILDIVGGDRANLTFPWFHSENGSVPLHGSLGGVKLCANSSVVQSCRAIQLFYYLHQDDRTKTDLWLKSFLRLLSNTSSASIQVQRTSILTFKMMTFLSPVLSSAHLPRCHTPPPGPCSGSSRKLQEPSSAYSPPPTPSLSPFPYSPAGGSRKIFFSCVETFADV